MIEGSVASQSLSKGTDSTNLEKKSLVTHARKDLKEMINILYRNQINFNVSENRIF